MIALDETTPDALRRALRDTGVPIRYIAEEASVALTALFRFLRGGGIALDTAIKLAVWVRSTEPPSRRAGVRP